MNDVLEKIKLENIRLSENYHMAERAKLTQEEKSRSEIARLSREIQGMKNEK